MHNLKIGLIGCGYWGRNYLRIISQDVDSELIAVADIEDSSFAPFTEAYSGVHFSTRAADLISDPDIDAIVICTSVSSHYSLVAEALGAGKHVLCEKPLTLTRMECEELCSLAEEAKRVLLVGHVFEYNSIVSYMKGVIRDQGLGMLHYMTMARTGLGPIRQDVNVVYDLASHDVSIAISLIGDMPIAVSAFGTCIIQQDREDVAFIILEFSGGVKVQINCSWIDPMKQRLIKVVGSKGMMLFDDVSPSEKLRIVATGKDYQNKSGDFGSFQLSVKDGEIIIPNIPYPEPLQTQFRHFVDCISKDVTPVTGVAYASATVLVLEAIQQSLRNNSIRISLT